LIITSYNVNGIRAAQRKGFCEWVQETQPDVICLQEIKADETQIPEKITSLGYHAFYHPAVKKGYSGVAILSRIEPELVEIGMNVDWIDSEGRVIKARINGVDVYSVYAPSGTTGDIRQQIKYKFLDEFSVFAQKVLAEGQSAVFCGDFNIAHTEIDIHDPVSNKKSSGFLPEEREWLTKFINLGFYDVFREKNPGARDLYSWWTYRAGAKSRNKGWRIDYHLATSDLVKKAGSAKIERELDMSDHAPVTIKYNL
jgi:exodeoxyribonuclease III